MSEIKIGKLGKICLAHFESRVIPSLESCPSQFLLEPHSLGEVMMISKAVSLPKVEERVWKRVE